MKKEVINIATNNGKSVTEAQLFSIDGFEETFAVHKSEDYITEKNVWHVTELSTGMRVVSDLETRKAAIAKAEIRMKSNAIHWADVKSKSISMLRKLNISYPLNIPKS